jgi:hypothetical protein
MMLRVFSQDRLLRGNLIRRAMAVPPHDAFALVVTNDTAAC